jgi:adenosylcobinamide-GDP ribazoletransferase
MLRPFEIAISFLTIFKVHVEPAPEFQEIGRSAWCFPLVGALMGVLLVCLHMVLSGHLSVFLVAVLVVGLWIFLTGGLHLDGWTDCWDALAASVTPERRMEILKDSRLGTFGALGLILLLAVKTGSVAQEHLSITALFAAPIIGRGFLVFTSYGSRHRGEGMGALFLAGLERESARRALLIAIAAAVLCGFSGILAAAGAYIAAVWFMRFAEARLPAINGDVIGAVCELSETVFLLITCIRW